MRLSTTLLLLALAAPAAGQELNVTFRYIPDVVVEDAFLPGTFNGWGQPYNNSGCIQPDGASQMEFVRFQDYWRKTVALNVGQRYEYKVQVHRDFNATQCDWLSDPLNPETNPNDNNNSVLVVSDPMTFQPAEELSASGTVQFFSAGLFSTAQVTAISFVVNGISRDDGLDFYDAATGVFRFELDRELRSGAQFAIEATDADGRTVSTEIGTLQPPVEWTTPAFTTVEETAEVRGFITRLDGSIDPTVTGANALREGGGTTFVPVTDGLAEFTAALELGTNVFRLEATVEGQTFTSDPITLTRRLHPLDAYVVEATVGGSGFGFTIDLSPVSTAPIQSPVTWGFDERLSTAGVTWGAAGLQLTGTADGPGELYFDVELSAGPSVVDRLRVAVIIEEDGTARPMEYAENAAWTKKAVVYEIFPLQFGTTAFGTVTNPGNRLDQITEELDYIADMGFNTIWFMPIMRNRNGMTPLGAGYNIIDFKQVDERLGTNEDLRELVDRAHELGIRVILDITPSHVSPDHPWVNSLRDDGPFSDYIQTTPSLHNRGQDGRGANLPEIWQNEGGQDLYRKYQGFGDLANLNWDDDDLQAEMLDVFAFWLDEFDIDGFRMDVWWGPTRRYGVGRFGRPVRQLIKRQRPDAWILGEITGTGNATEVYYADDDNGSVLVEGGLDSAYDWNLYWNGFRGTFGATSTYNALGRNGDFWPGPNARYFRFLENHDEERIAKRHSDAQIRALTSLLLTTTGVPMIYAGQEVNYGGGSGDTRRTAVNWNTTNNGEMAAHHQRLAQVRQRYPAFWTQAITPILVSSRPRVYAYARPFLDQNAVVAINFDDTPSTVTIDPSSAVEMSIDGPYPYYDVFADTSGSYLGGFEITLPAYGTAVYITQDAPGFVLPNLPSLPFGATYTSVAGAEDLPSQVGLAPAYPNPVRQSATLQFDLPRPVAVTLELFDMLGRKAMIVAQGVYPAGTHQAHLDASDLPSGTYVYRLQTPNGSKSSTLVVVK